MLQKKQHRYSLKKTKDPTVTGRLKDEFLYLLAPLTTSSDAFDVPAEPHLPAELVSYLSDWVKKGDLVFEYGSGGSTGFFAELGAAIVSVESDLRWARAIRQDLSNARLRGSFHILYRGLGPSRNWGHPIYDANGPIARWRHLRYVSAPWQYIRKSAPRFVLIDGRLRVACAAYTAIQFLERGISAEVILDDFFSRDFYRDVLSLYDLVDDLGDAAILRISKNAEKGRAVEIMEKHITDTR